MISCQFALKVSLHTHHDNEGTSQTLHTTGVSSYPAVTTPEDETTKNSSHSDNTAVIVGSVLGSTVLTAALVASILLFVHLKRKNQLTFMTDVTTEKERSSAFTLTQRQSIQFAKTWEIDMKEIEIGYVRVPSF